MQKKKWKFPREIEETRRIDILLPEQSSTLSNDKRCWRNNKRIDTIRRVITGYRYEWSNLLLQDEIFITSSSDDGTTKYIAGEGIERRYYRRRSLRGS